MQMYGKFPGISYKNDSALIWVGKIMTCERWEDERTNKTTCEWLNALAGFKMRKTSLPPRKESTQKHVLKEHISA